MTRQDTRVDRARGARERADQIIADAAARTRLDRHPYTIEEYDQMHTAIGLSVEWMTSARREETIAEIAAGVGPHGLRDGA